jgi:peroxiredoxin
MEDNRLRVGDTAPDFALLAAVRSEVSVRTLDALLEGNQGVVLTTYVLDFTGG